LLPRTDLRRINYQRNQTHEIQGRRQVHAADIRVDDDRSRLCGNRLNRERSIRGARGNRYCRRNGRAVSRLTR
jgi:hypothetical protein